MASGDREELETPNRVQIHVKQVDGKPLLEGVEDLGDLRWPEETLSKTVDL